MAGRFMIFTRSSISCLVFYMAILLFFSGCSSGGSHVIQKEKYAGAPAPTQEANRARKAAMADSSSRSAEDEVAPAEEETGGENPSGRPRMVIHTGRFNIEVDNVRSAVDDAERIARDLGGFLESSSSSDSYRKAVAVIRIPVENFFKALQAVERMGTVTYRSVESADVTMEFQDTTLRMETLEKVRTRLYDLLKKTTKVEEQVKILREIERITATIDSLKARLAWLQNRAALSTITIEFTARVREISSRYIPSPFPWIAGLDPDRRSIAKNFRDVICDTPDGFFTLDRKRSTFDFTSPGERTSLRLGSVENMPPADAPFWDEAVMLDLANRRLESSPLETVRGQYGLEFHLVRVKGPGLVYTVAWAVSGDVIVVVEMVQRQEGAADESSSFKKFLATVRFR